MKDIVLLITNEADQVQEIQSALKKYSVLSCSEPRQARDYCRKHDIDLVILADEPPRIEAYALFKELQQENPNLNGVLLAASIDNRVMTVALESGFSGLLELPADSVQVQRTVDRVMRQVKLQSENTRLKTLLPLYSLGEQFLSSTTEKEVLDCLLASVADLTDSAHISILLFDSTREVLYIAAASGLDEQLVKTIQVLPGENVAGWVFKHGKSVLLNKEEQDNTIFAPFLRRPEIVSAISCPMRIRSEVIGVLNISRTQTDSRFSEADMEIVSVVCTQAAMAIDNVRAFRRVKETTRMRTLLEQYVSPEVADLLLHMESDLLQVGNVQEVTILFADIRNFTGLVQQVDLQELRKFLNGFFDIFTETVFDKQGTVDKFMGDAVLAVFGAPLKNDDAVLAAAEAALVIRQKFEALRKGWVGKGDVFNVIDLGIGLTCGKVFLGNVGSSKRLDYTVIGHEVNVAQRLAAESSRCRIFLTPEVQQRLPKRFVVEKHPGVRIRGVENEMTVYTLMGEESESL